MPAAAETIELTLAGNSRSRPGTKAAGTPEQVTANANANANANAEGADFRVNTTDFQVYGTRMFQVHFRKRRLGGRN